MTSTSARVSGRDAYLPLMADDRRPGVVFRRTPEEVRVFDSWRMASERGRWTRSWTAADGEVRIGGSYCAKWREINGRWLIESETFVPEACRGGADCNR